jgi:3',5'-cyclic AMP phosphodiesterase CpdA
LVAAQETGAGASTYRVIVDLAFRETAGKPARVIRLKVEIFAPSGWSTERSYDTDLPITALGAASYKLTTVVEAAASNTSARWRLTATVVDEEGQALEAAAVETELSFPAPAPAPDEIFVGAGDIARCGAEESEATAKLLDRIPGTVFTLGDNVYPRGTAELFAQCYEPTWGRHKRRTFPTPGNHDWEEAAGAPYFAYFGASAGPAGLGYYSYTLGAWHIISLNSQVGAGPGSPQYEWLKADLAASPAACTLAMWHHPLFSSGPNGNTSRMRDVWRVLNQSGVDVVLSGNDHVYERFAPQDADARPSPRGIREFVVGTGGYALYNRASFQPNSEAWENQTWGVLKLTLKTGGYSWEFVPIAGKTFRDFGSAACVTP